MTKFLPPPVCVQVKKQEEEELRSKVKAEKAAVRKQRRRHKRRQQPVHDHSEERGEVWIMPGQDKGGGAVGGASDSPQEIQQDSMISLSSTKVVKIELYCLSIIMTLLELT